MTQRIVHHTLLRTVCAGLVLALASVGCTEDEAQRLRRSITIVQETAVLQEGGTFQLAALAHFSDDTAEDVTARAEWTSSDPAVVTIDESGLATAVGEGVATVIAAYGGFESAPTTITVEGPEPPAALQALRILPELSFLKAGGTLQFTAIGVYDDGSSVQLTDQLTWRTSDSAVAAISQDGLVTAVAKGSAEIRVERGDLMSPSVVIQVWDAELVAVQIEPPGGTLHAGSAVTLSLEATGVFSDGATVELTKIASWASSDPTLATVDGGLVSAMNKSGVARITAEFGGITSQAALVHLLPSSDIDSIEVTADDDSVPAGFTIALTAMATYADGRMVDVTHDAIWQSLNQSVVTVGAHGVASGLAVGTATINATLDGVTGSRNLTVTDALLEKLMLEPESATLPVGVTQPFVAMGAFSDGTTKDVSAQVTWEISNPQVASVDPSGVVTGLSAGAAGVKASLGEYSVSALLMVTDALLEALSVEPLKPAPLAAGLTQQFKVMGTYSDGAELDLTANKNISWSSDDPQVAQISNAPGSEGLATGLTAGAAAISALYNDPATLILSPSIPLVVIGPMLDSIELMPAQMTIAAGKTTTFMAIGHYSDQTSADITGAVLWSSSKPAIAAVDQAGQATAAIAGETVIEATLQGVIAKATLVVTPAVLELVMVLPPAPQALPVGAALQFQALGIYSDGAEQDLTTSADLTWFSTYPAVANVSNASGAQGLATAMAEGGTHIRAVFDDGALKLESAPALLSVIPAAIIDLTLEPAAASVPIGMVTPFHAMATFSDNSVGDVTNLVAWSSTDATVASVDDMGQVTALKLGVTLIRAKWQTIEATALATITPAELVALTVAPQSPAPLPVGLDQAFTAKGLYSDGALIDLTGHPKLKWISSNPAVATLDGGLAIAIQEGGTLITAHFKNGGGVEISANPVLLSVVPALLEAIAIDPATASIPAGSTVKFFATGTFSDGSARDISKEVQWLSSDPGVATLDLDGTAHGQAPGAADITAKSGDLQAMASLEVNHAQLVAVQIEPAAPAALPVGLEQQFAATGLYTDGSAADLSKNANLTWTSSHPSVAVIQTDEDKCKALGLSEGGTEIGAVYDDGEITIAASAVPLAVVPALLEQLEIDPIDALVPHGFDVAFAATGKFSDGGVKDVTEQVSWTSSNPDAATISNAEGLEGVATGKAPGKTLIKAELGGMSAATTLDVTGADLVSIAINPPAFDVAVGLSKQFEATGNFNDGSTMALTKLATWSVHPSDLGRGVTISNATSRQGLATVATTAVPDLNPVTLLASLGSVNAVAEVTIVNPVTLIGIQVDVEPNVVPIGLSAQATALGLYSDGVHPPEAIDITELVTWEPDNNFVVAISNAAGSKGRVTGLNAGVALINACLGAVCANDFAGPGNADLVFVTQCPFDQLVIEPNNAPAKKLPRGTSRKYTVKATYDTTAGGGCALLAGVSYDLTELATWSSSNPAVATASNKAGNRGFVQAAQNPPFTAVKIRAMFDTFEAELPLTVIDACVESIVVSPASADLPAGVRKQFAATADLTDGSTIAFTDLATWQVTGDIGLVDAGLIQTFAGDAGTLRATSKATGQCPKVEAAVTIVVNDAQLIWIGTDPTAAAVAIGSTIFLQATGHYSDGTSYELTDIATWSSVNPAVASAGAGGKIKGKADGQVIVLATVGKVTGTASIAVGGLDLVKITLAPSGTFPCGDFGGKGYMAGAVVPMQATATYSDGSQLDVTAAVGWSSDAAFINVDSDGNATMVSPGTALISAAMDGVTGARSVKVLNSTLVSIKVMPGNGFAVPINSTRQFGARGTYQATVGGALLTDTCDIGGSVSWKAAPVASMSVDAMGLVTTTAAVTNSATVTAQKDAVVKAVTGKVVAACVEHVAVEPMASTTTVGISIQFTASAVLSDGSAFDITESPDTQWATSNPAVAGVTDGMAEPVGPGLVLITATYKPGTAACAGVGKFINETGSLQVTPAALVDVSVACDRANQTWPGPFGPVNGLPAGLVTQCHATGKYADGSTADITQSVNWLSSDADVVSISDAADNKGSAKTLTAGFANITAVFGGVTGSLSFGVVSATLDQINVLGPAKLPAGFGEQYEANARFTLGTVSRWYDITELAMWSSSMPAVAGVSNDPAGKGYVTTFAAGGPAAIEATYLSVTGARLVTALDVVLDRIELDPAGTTLAIGQKLQWRADGVYMDAAGGAYVRDISHLVSWFTTQPAIASIDATGLVTTYGLGDVAIVAELGAASGDAGLTVEDKCITGIAIKPSTASLPAGVPMSFQVIAYFTSGPPQDVTSQVVYKTSDAGRMPAPDATGYAYTQIGAAPGAVTLTATMLSGGCSGKPASKAIVTINTAALQSIAVYGDPPFVPIGLKTQYNAVGSYTDGTSYDITRTIDAWKSGNKTVATVSNGKKHKGMVTGVDTGSAPIAATQESVTGASSVEVVAATLVTIDVKGFRTDGKCRLFSTPAAWLDAGWQHPMGGFTTWARAIGHFSDGSTAILTDGVSWSTMDATKALISNAPGFQGRVQTLSAGQVLVKATHPSGVEGQMELDVVDQGLDLLVLNPTGPDPVKLALGNQHQLALRGRFGPSFYCITEDASYLTVGDSVSVSNAVGSRGRVDTLALGDSVITALVGTVNDNILVQIGDPTLDSIEIVPAELEMLIGETAQLRAFAHFSDGSVNDVTWHPATAWAVHNTLIAELTATKGLIRAKGVGETFVWACLTGVCSIHSNDNASITVNSP